MASQPQMKTQLTKARHVTVELHPQHKCGITAAYAYTQTMASQPQSSH
jgi:hypothetical protein